METVNGSFFQTTFTEEIACDLYLKDFWLLEEPCHWTLTHYLESLVKHDPAVCNRSASVRVLHDAKIIQGHVVAGTVAETMITTIANYPTNVRARKVFKDYFKDHATPTGQAFMMFNTQKSRLRSAMLRQIADEEEISTHKRSHGESSSGGSRIEQKRRRANDDDAGGEEDDEKLRCIWTEWKEFLDNPDNTAHLFQLSPEKHNVIWCGKFLRRRSCYPAKLYERTNEKVSSIKCKIADQSLIDAVNDVVDATMEQDCKLISEKKFINNILLIFAEEVYVNVGAEILHKSETVYRSYIFDPCLKNVTKHLHRTGYKITFLPGEIELDAITKQLRESGMKDGRYHYNEDGILRADEFSNVELLLTEVSNGYGSNSSGKASFDYYKAMFGMLAMVRTSAQKYSKASFNTFQKLKMHFLHGHGNAVRHWSMSVQAPGVFVMNKEQRVEVLVNFCEKNEALVPFVQFYSTVSAACAETIDTMRLLKNEHIGAARKNSKTESLANIVNPVVVRLNEGKHTTIVAEEGPMSVPGSPNRD